MTDLRKRTLYSNRRGITHPPFLYGKFKAILASKEANINVSILSHLYFIKTIFLDERINYDAKQVY